MADLRDSGSIEQDADVVLFPFREEYYVNQAIAAGDEEAAMRLGAVRNVLELNVAKNRQGQCGTVRAYCDISRNIIRDLERRYG
jgi:replicative DNA helicase